jgi:hypothetical protein
MNSFLIVLKYHAMNTGGSKFNGKNYEFLEAIGDCLAQS